MFRLIAKLLLILIILIEMLFEMLFQIMLTNIKSQFLGIAPSKYNHYLCTHKKYKVKRLITNYNNDKEY